MYKRQYLERIWKWAKRVGNDTVKEQVLDDPARRRALYDRFLYSQQFAQLDPWKERAEGKDAHEFAPLADLSARPREGALV